MSKKGGSIVTYKNDNARLIEDLGTHIRSLDERSSKFRAGQLQLEKAIDEEEIRDIHNRLYQLLSRDEASTINNRKMYLHISSDVIRSFEPLTSATIRDAIIDGVEFKLEYMGSDLWHILMPMLPNNQGIRKSKWIGSTMPYLIECSYKSIVAELEPKPKRSDKMLIIFYHHYNMKKHFRNEIDIDNFNIKTMIDALSPYLILSDSVRSLSVCQFGIEDTQYYTEIFLGPNNRTMLNILFDKSDGAQVL